MRRDAAQYRRRDGCGGICRRFQVRWNAARRSGAKHEAVRGGSAAPYPARHLPDRSKCRCRPLSYQGKGPGIRTRNMEYDLVIRDGTIVDGSGLPGYQADVGLKNGRILSIGKIRASAEHVIEAEGHVVAPGFIDGHTHMDAQVFWDPLGTCSCWHGVTSVVMGNCGFSLAPCSEKDKLLVCGTSSGQRTSRHGRWKPASNGRGTISRNIWTPSKGFPRVSTTLHTSVIRRYARMSWVKEPSPTRRPPTICRQ